MCFDCFRVSLGYFSQSRFFYRFTFDFVAAPSDSKRTILDGHVVGMKRFDWPFTVGYKFS